MQKIILVIFLLLPFSVFAQNFIEAEEIGKQKKKTSQQEKNTNQEQKDTKKQNRLRVTFFSEFLYFDNADFVSYDYNTYKTYRPVDRLNTDDRSYFVYSSLNIGYDAYFNRSEFHIEAYRSGFWGNDNLETKDDGKNPVAFYKLYFYYSLADNLFLTFGRQKFSIGNSLYDYFFSDIVDGLRLDFFPMQDLKIVFLTDVLGIAAKPDTYLYSTQKDSEDIDDFNGEVLSLRTGIMLEYKIAKIFSFYVKYGANKQGGADRAENGLNDINQPDGDFLFMNGLRIFDEKTLLDSLDLTLAYSYGRDYQFDKKRTYKGIAIALNGKQKFDDLFSLQFSFGYFQPQFAMMKGISMGGLLLFANKGYFPSPYASAYHFKDYAKTDPPSITDRTVSKTFGKIEGLFSYQNWNIGLNYLRLYETKKETSFGYMGSEMEFLLGVSLENLKIELHLALFLPSSIYYKNRSATNTYFPIGDDPFYGINLACSYSFDL